MDMYHRYFVYSAEQKKDKENIAKSMEKVYVPGTTVVKGYTKKFTDIIIDLDRFPYADVQVIIQGDIRKIHHTAPYNK